MELIRISDRKLKIMLTPLDMSHFELNADSFGEDTAQMHRAFRLLFDEIRQQIDFEADDNRISVQYFPSREGGCEMFICNLQGEERDGTPHTLTAPPPPVGTNLHPVKKQSGHFRRDCAYRFETLSHLLLACRRLSSLDCITESEAYRDEKNKYFLLLTVLTSSPFSTPEELDFVVEYGSIENASLLRVYIKEHAHLISAPHAVVQLGNLS